MLRRRVWSVRLRPSFKLSSYTCIDTAIDCFTATREKNAHRLKQVMMREVNEYCSRAKRRNGHCNDTSTKKNAKQSGGGDGGGGGVGVDTNDTELIQLRWVYKDSKARRRG